MKHPKQPCYDRQQMIERLGMRIPPHVDIADERQIEDVLRANGDLDDYLPAHVDAAMPEIADYARELRQCDDTTAFLAIVVATVALLFVGTDARAEPFFTEAGTRTVLDVLNIAQTLLTHAVALTVGWILCAASGGNERAEP